MKNSTAIRIGMFSIGLIWWSIYRGLHFVFPIIYNSTHELYNSVSLFLLLIIVGELFVMLDNKALEHSLNVERLEAEKMHVYNVGLFGNSKELRNKAIIIGQACNLMERDILDYREGVEMISSNTKQIINTLDMNLSDLENQIATQRVQ